MKSSYLPAIVIAAAVLMAGCEVPPGANAPLSANGSNSQTLEDPFDPDRPPTARTLYLMADILTAQGKDPQAEQLYRRIQSQYPEFRPAYTAYAALLMRQRRIPEATHTLEAGLDRFPADPVLLNNMGMCFLIRKDYSRALDYFTDAAAVVPENTRYRSNMATVLALMGRQDEALALYRQILPKSEAMENIRVLCDMAQKETH
jgi:serine/threonine-protein kinase